MLVLVTETKRRTCCANGFRVLASQSIHYAIEYGWNRFFLFFFLREKRDAQQQCVNGCIGGAGLQRDGNRSAFSPIACACPRNPIRDGRGTWPCRLVNRVPASFDTRSLYWNRRGPTDRRLAASACSGRIASARKRPLYVYVPVDWPLFLAALDHDPAAGRRSFHNSFDNKQ